MTRDAVLAIHLIWLWIGFSLAFVVLASLWSLIDGPARRASRARSWTTRVALFVLVGAGCIGAASLAGDDGLWTGLTLWVGILAGLIVVISLFGDLRRWGKEAPRPPVL